MDEDLTDVLTARERERHAALVADDRDRLADLMTDDLVHVHTTGQVHDKSQLLDHAFGVLRFIDVARGPLRIRRIAPGAAIMTGSMTNTIQPRASDQQIVVRAFVTQIWVLQDDAWRVASFHAVKLQDDGGARG